MSCTLSIVSHSRDYSCCIKPKLMIWHAGYVYVNIFLQCLYQCITESRLSPILSCILILYNPSCISLCILIICQFILSLIFGQRRQRYPFLTYSNCILSVDGRTASVTYICMILLVRSNRQFHARSMLHYIHVFPNIYTIFLTVYHASSWCKQAQQNSSSVQTTQTLIPNKKTSAIQALCATCNHTASPAS